jgi:hypothetical protein
MMRRFVRLVAAGWVLTACGKPSADAAKSASQAGMASASAPTTDRWEQFDYASKSVTTATLDSLPLITLQHIRGIIFGRHGRIFEDTTLQHWLASRPWYHPDTSFTNASLWPREKENLDLVREAEAKKHTQIETGDMRFYQNRVITTAMLGTHSPQDWEVLEAEVLANHGFVFEGDLDDDRQLQGDDLQKYFDERYWYHPDPQFKAEELSPTERQNLDTMALAVMKQNERAVSPGVMNLFQNTALTEAMLTNVNLADLRLLRNEIYARHGRPFATPWLADHFRSEPWYKPRSDYSDAELSPIERANIAVIAKREDELHRSLSTRLLTAGDVRGLRPDDARRLRNEIYARHGRRFHDPMLQMYFASFSWYKPNDEFRENQLNETERLNAELISQYEHGRFTEG